MSEMIQLFGVNNTFFVMLALFVGTYVIVSNVALKKVRDTVVGRDERTHGRDEQIKELSEDISKLSVRFEDENQKARLEAISAVAKQREHATKEQKKLLDAAREQASAQVEDTRKSLAVTVANESKKVESEAADLGRQIIAKFLGKNPPAFGAGKDEDKQWQRK